MIVLLCLIDFVDWLQSLVDEILVWSAKILFHGAGCRAGLVLSIRSHTCDKIGVN